MNAPDPPHWTLNSCFGVFCTIWMHLGPFGCRTKLGAKRAEVVQKFVPRSRVIIFRNKHPGLTSLGPKVMFWCVSYYLGGLAIVWFPNKTGCKTAWSGAKVSVMKSCHNFSKQTIRSTPLDPNLMFRCVSYYLGAFGRVWLRYKTQCKMGRTGAKFRATRSLLNFSQQTHSIGPVGT